MLREHELIKREIGHQFESRGYKVDLEAWVGRKLVDILAIKQQESIAIEVGDVTKDDLAYVALLVDEVFHVPKTNQKPIQVNGADIISAVERAFAPCIFHLCLIVKGAQKFASKPQKFTLEIPPNGEWSWKFSDLEAM